MVRSVANLCFSTITMDPPSSTDSTDSKDVKEQTQQTEQPSEDDKPISRRKRAAVDVQVKFDTGPDGREMAEF